MSKKKLEGELFAEDVREVIPVIKKGRQKLSAAQSEFNRLNKKIQALRENIRELPEREQVIKVFFDKYAASLFDEERDLKFQLLERLDEIYEGNVKLTKKEKSALPELVLKEMENVDDFNMSQQQQQRADELREKYWDIVSGMTKEDREQESVAMTLDLCCLMGVQPNKKMENAKTMAEFEEALYEFMNEAKEKEAEKEQTKAKSKKASAEPKTKKVSQRELKRKLQEEQTLKSVREIYIELVKELHPDKELDEKKRQQKEERMKQLTEAYQAKDLSALLRMQVEWLEESAISPETQTDEVLKRYNKMLRTQLKRLEEEYFLLCQSPIPGVLGAYGDFRKCRLNELQDKLENLLLIHECELNSIKTYTKSFSTNSGAKKALKEFAENLANRDPEKEAFLDFLNLF